MANLLLTTPGLSRVAKRVAGIDRRRPLPRFAHQTLRCLVAPPLEARPDPGPPGPAVEPDTFTNHFTPRSARPPSRSWSTPATRWTPSDETLCCALTWISTGQLTTAKRVPPRRTVDRLAALVGESRGSVALVGLEPSCLAVLRHDALQLLGEDDRRRWWWLGRRRRWRRCWRPRRDGVPPDLSGVVAVAQPHCHQHAVLDCGPDRTPGPRGD